MPVSVCESTELAVDLFGTIRILFTTVTRAGNALPLLLILLLAFGWRGARIWLVAGWRRLVRLRLNLIIRHGDAGEGCLKGKWMLIFAAESWGKSWGTEKLSG